MKNKEKYKQMSKFFTKVLRHSPSEFGITLGKNNYCKLEDFVEAVQQHFHTPVTEEEIAYVLLYSMWDDIHRFDVWKGYVRATYKHTHNQVIPQEDVKSVTT